MPVTTKATHENLVKSLNCRFRYLMDVIGKREIESSRDGVWKNQDNLCATVGTAMDIRLAVEDFKAILAEIKRLK